MSQLLTIAKDEWRFWLRSRLALWGIGVFGVLLIATSVLTAMQVSESQHERTHSQHEAEKRFVSQPARHPHRMVHYGHYVFRTPAPLAIFDPGLDSVTGQSIFLEGHRQNSETFASAGSSANLGGLSWLTPALVYQLFGALLFVLLGYGAIVREREAATLPTILLHGVSGAKLVFGKWLALFILGLAAVLPLFVVAQIAEGLLAALSLAATYLIYLMLWASVTLFLSTVIRGRAGVLTAATAVWLSVCLLIPSLAVDIVSRNTAQAGKIENDLALLVDMRKLGDGHNASDPAFASIRANLLAQYDVESVEELPVNFRGVVAVASEEKLTATLNAYATTRMDGELLQARRLDQFGWLSPMLAVAAASRAMSGTDIEHYHRFLRDAETLRYEFVQALNNIHATQIAYSDDIKRSADARAEKRSRASADNWQLLDDFQFEPAALTARFEAATPALVSLMTWSVALLGLLLWAGRRLAP
ncbi:MAG: ABC transporter permease [Gammaproteobacteria bacterium]